MKKIWTLASQYVKNRAFSIDETRELCRSINEMHHGTFSLNNTSREERWSNSQQRWQNEARQISLRARMSQLPQIA
jgi:TRAP-type mannitol/chloroaromatic compound transport system substrate-binding protein